MGAEAVPLVIHLRKGQQAIVNGAVLENIGARNLTLAVKNEAAVLRDGDVLAPCDAVTPASRVYYALQCAYLFPDPAGEAVTAFQRLLLDYVQAAPSASLIAAEMLGAVEAGQFYVALKTAQTLLQHERKVLCDVEERLIDRLQCPAGTGQSAADRGLGADPGCPAHEGQPGGH
jgi:flagellar protein FlbT